MVELELQSDDDDARILVNEMTETYGGVSC